MYSGGLCKVMGEVTASQCLEMPQGWYECALLMPDLATISLILIVATGVNSDPEVGHSYARPSI
jgi:hypothetical protein